MTDFQLLIWCGREVMGTSVSDAKGECVVVAMADTKSTHHPLLVVTMFGFFFSSSSTLITALAIVVASSSPLPLILQLLQRR